MLIVENIHVAYGSHQVLKGVSFQAEAGEMIDLLGQNGAGKSTLILTLAGIVRPSQGQVELNGVPLSKRRVYLKSVGYVSQEIALTMHLSGRDNLCQWGSFKKLTGQALATAVEEAADICGLRDFWDQPIKELSGGMQRRVHLACGLLGHPKLLLLDEPTVGLDDESRKQIDQAILHMKDQGTIVVRATHDLRGNEALTPRALVLEGGVLCPFSA
ncbi:MAG: ABC transporter ATP-binding protein [Eubacteriales bacterium]|nr:ABC transporter ATP-binding protein [Clostridiales bacterium]MDY5836068.1 ABC transporter ATP-binding protein [Eubacteriales bacterium]